MLDQDMRERLESLSTPLLVDARCQLDLAETHLDAGIKPVVPFTTMAGTAVTVLLEAVCDESNADLTELTEAYVSQDVKSNLIIVIQVPPELHSYGIFGGGAATLARANGFVGALVEGAVRDTHDLREMQFPAFARTVAPGYIVHKSAVTSVSEPVVIGGRTIRQGDVVVGDNDGVVLIRPDELETVVAKAEAIAEWEHRTHELLGTGLSLQEAEQRVGPMP